MASSSYIICRIVGNELPPRDLPGSRIEVFEYIKNNEYLSLNCKRIWIINRILDDSLRNQVKSQLTENNESFVELGINWQEYIAARSRGERLNALIGINNARNEAFKAGSALGAFVIVLDGDCFFDKTTWESTVAELERDQATNPHRSYYAIPTSRIQKSILPLSNYSELHQDEPMLAMRSDATMRYDELRDFGRKDKTDLLNRLGIVRQGPRKWYALNSTGPCTVIGNCLHLTTGSELIETDEWIRYSARTESLDNLLSRADRIAGQIIMETSMMSFFRFRMRCDLMRMQAAVKRIYSKVLFGIKFPIRRLVKARSKSL